MGFRSTLGPVYWNVREVPVVGGVVRRGHKVYTVSHVAVYRWTGGRLGGRIGKAPVLLLSTEGRRSGEWRTTPLMYLATDTALVVVASAGASPRHPDWFLNLKANPRCVVEADRSRRHVIAHEAAPDERSLLWPRLVQIYAGWDEYQRRTDRQIPVVVLEPDS
ncbi:MAG: nitroreductase family deazaflavin-dependent oxidoreductase [Actinomycetota bacterium]|nr:nitroreductase family deazaflavin-dependent oxidoreductase [Actinomycetota bacterium]